MDTNGDYLADEGSSTYSWLSGFNGNGWLNFYNLPAGTYKLEVRKAVASLSGKMPFTVQALGASSALGLV